MCRTGLRRASANYVGEEKFIGIYFVALSSTNLTIFRDFFDFPKIFSFKNLSVTYNFISKEIKLLLKVKFKLLKNI